MAYHELNLSYCNSEFWREEQHHMDNQSQSLNPQLLNLWNNSTAIDHIAIAVTNIEESLDFFTRILGFHVTERRQTEGKLSGMLSAVLKGGPLTFVLLQGTSEESQVTKFINAYGPGIQHIAIKVTNLNELVDMLVKQGMEFDTSIVGNQSLRQIFSKRDKNSGLMFELLERAEEGFSDDNVSGLFEQLESKGRF